MAFLLHVVTEFTICVLLATAGWFGIWNVCTLNSALITYRIHLWLLCLTVGCVVAARWLYLLSGGAL